MEMLLMLAMYVNASKLAMQVNASKIAMYGNATKLDMYGNASYDKCFYANGNARYEWKCQLC